MENKKLKVGNVPPLRFPGFEEEWQTKRLGEIADKVNSGKTPLGGEAVYTKEGILFIRSQNVNNDRLELDNSVFIPESVNNQMKNSIVNPNDILLNITGASLGRSCVVSNDFKIGNVNQHVCIIRLSQQYNPRFIQPIFSSNKGQIIFNNLQTGSGREGLNFESIKGIKLFTPILDEQLKIASFLSLIDERIQTQSKIIKQLETLIKGLSEKIFSRKIRFREFKDGWTLKSLGEICEKTKSGGTPKSTIKEYYEGNIPFLSISDMTIQGKYLFSTERNISELGLKSSASWIVPINSIIYSMYASVGFVSINKIELATSQAVLNLIPKNEINREYLYYYLVYFQKYVDKYITTGTQGNLNAETVKSFEIYLPTSKEQNTIVQFLSSIDTKIETEKNILDKYHSQKQYLLQNLFI
ncbi:EcoKI restriction-modification system protein HsdS [Sphingobacterium multivorum]|uniref:EcoKI restriction-modification system protein HsdS n=2 Tax=Sphingobacterium multivorum TaxID=28454 RepID=A0A2X2JJ45_SPHMU|nr:restriction endonuclease subunit S [Sphingobacterium multivorum]SPZ92156.1 EcoKI restriction-modification system protein HsdS [Sphingobacterium multivorum]